MTDAKLALVLCYFGPLPNYADLFFNSVRANPEIDFILVTDQLVKEPPANLKIKQLTLPALRAKFQRKISFPIRLHQPYKICDYRPAFGCWPTGSRITATGGIVTWTRSWGGWRNLCPPPCWPSTTSSTRTGI